MEPHPTWAIKCVKLKADAAFCFLNLHFGSNYLLCSVLEKKWSRLKQIRKLPSSQISPWEKPELNESLDIDFTEYAKGRFCGITGSLRLKFFYSNSCSLTVIENCEKFRLWTLLPRIYKTGTKPARNHASCLTSSVWLATGAVWALPFYFRLLRNSCSGSSLYF